MNGVYVHIHSSKQKQYWIDTCIFPSIAGREHVYLHILPTKLSPAIIQFNCSTIYFLLMSRQKGGVRII